MAEFLIRLILQIIFLPVMCILATPVIFIAAGFGPGKYTENVRRYYGKVLKLWDKIDFFI